jgi:hypothetical protein
VAYVDALTHSATARFWSRQLQSTRRTIQARFSSRRSSSSRTTRRSVSSSGSA